MRTPIIYYGGKTSMLSVIIPMIPEHRLYTESFFGGGALYFEKKPSPIEIINDTSDIVVNFYTVLQTRFSQLKKLINQTCYSQLQFSKALLIVRNKEMFSQVELAWAFWMTSNFAYGQNITHGSLRSSNGEFNSTAKTMAYKKSEFTDLMKARIDNAIILKRYGVEVLNLYNKKNAFHYIDPPYPNANQGHYRGYTFDDFEILLKWCESCKGKFLLSNYNSDMLDGFIKRNGWNKSEHIGKNKSLRKNDIQKREVLIWNYKAPHTNLKMFE